MPPPLRASARQLGSMPADALVRVTAAEKEALAAAQERDAAAAHAQDALACAKQARADAYGAPLGANSDDDTLAPTSPSPLISRRLFFFMRPPPSPICTLKLLLCRTSAC